MEAQTPAQGILAMKSFPDAKYYKVPCECGCDAEITFSVEIDEYVISTHIYAQTKTAYWRTTFPLTYTESWLVYALKDFANSWISRIAVCWTALTKGYVETESYVLLTKQQTLNFSDTLKVAIDELEKNQSKV